MSEREYPEYIQRLLSQAEALIESDDYAQADAAALCYEVLALFPDHKEASNLIYRAFCDPLLVRDNRKAISRHIDEWDDRAWQQRRRLALSFRFMSRWEGQYREYEREDGGWPEDVRPMIEEGRGQLLQDYLMGQARGGEIAWPIFQEAIRRTSDPQTVMLSVAHLYADQGYFAEALDILEALLAQFPQADDARRLWAEVRWWRDNQRRIPWIPPANAGDGRRFRRIMARTDPDFAEDPEAWTSPLEHMPPDQDNLPPDFTLPEPLRPELVDKIETVLGQTPTPPVDESPVDWDYLDALESGEIDVSRFPEWAQYLLLEIDDPEQEEFLKQYLLSYLANPPLAQDWDEDEDWDEDDSGQI